MLNVQKDASRVPERLTRRQAEVLQYLLRGLGEKDIAAELGISRHTVHNHVKAIYVAQGVKSRYELFMLHAGPASGAGDAPRDSSLELLPLLGAMPDFITLLDTEGVIRYINRNTPQASPAEIVGTNLSRWFPESSLAVLAESLRRAVKTGHTVEFTVPNPDARGDEDPPLFRVRFNPVRQSEDVVSIVGLGWYAWEDPAARDGLEAASGSCGEGEKEGPEGAPFGVLVHVDDDASVSEAFNAALEVGGFPEVVIELPGADGTTRRMRARLEPIAEMSDIDVGSDDA
jgi:DNA-binding CsgD family transcriptional regulator